MKTRMMVAAGLSLLLAGTAFAQSADAALELAKKNGCLACHSLDSKMVGPSWKDVGRKYAGDAGAEADALLAAVRRIVRADELVECVGQD